MNKTRVRFEVDIDSLDNQLLNDVIGMVARLVYILKRISGIRVEYYVENTK